MLNLISILKKKYNLKIIKDCAKYLRTVLISNVCIWNEIFMINWCIFGHFIPKMYRHSIP